MPKQGELLFQLASQQIGKVSYVCICMISHRVGSSLLDNQSFPGRRKSPKIRTVATFVTGRAALRLLKGDRPSFPPAPLAPLAPLAPVHIPKEGAASAHHAGLGEVALGLDLAILAPEQSGWSVLGK